MRSREARHETKTCNTLQYRIPYQRSPPELLSWMQRANVRHQGVNLLLAERTLERRHSALAVGNDLSEPVSPKTSRRYHGQRHFRFPVERLLSSVYLKLNHVPAHVECSQRGYINSSIERTPT